MKKLNPFIAMTSLITTTTLAATVNFDDATPGAAPSGWTATKTGKGAAKWTIEAFAHQLPGVEILETQLIQEDITERQLRDYPEAALP